MGKGFIKLFRELQAHWLWDDKPFSEGQAWVDLLMLVNHAPARFKHGSHFIKLNRGQTVSSTYKLAKRWGWGEKKARNYLQQLEEDNMITREATPRYTVFKVRNYASWQGETEDKKDALGTHSGVQNGRTESPGNTGTPGNRDALRTYSGTESGPQTRSKEDKKNKEEKEEKKEIRNETKTNTVEVEAESNKLNQGSKGMTTGEKDVIPYEKIVALYHSACPDLPRIIKLTPARRNTIAARWKEYNQGMKPFFQLFNAAQASDFLRGHNHRQWHANFDWLLKAENMAKALEGNYSKGGGVNAPPGQNHHTHHPQSDDRHGKSPGGRHQYQGLGINLDELDL